jgi:hypothetical protein
MKGNLTIRKNARVSRFMGICLVTALMGVPCSPVVFAQQSPAQVQPPVPGQPTMPPINKNQLPDNPTPTPSNAAPATPAASLPVAPQVAGPPQPTGTAAAQAERPVGTDAFRPAGAAIAPPKQRQVRSLLIKLGAIAGAGAALGTVVALSAASPARVPGSHPATH